MEDVNYVRKSTSPDLYKFNHFHHMFSKKISLIGTGAASSTKNACLVAIFHSISVELQSRTSIQRH